jgi:hypothetical protein
MLDNPKICPEDLKPRVRERLTLNGVIKKVDRKIKQAMCTAIGALRGQEIDEQYLSALGFKATGTELTSLHAVFDYLQSVGLTWTLACLEQESHVPPTPPALSLVCTLHPELREPLSAADERPDGAADGDEEEDEEEELLHEE